MCPQDESMVWGWGDCRMPAAHWLEQKCGVEKQSGGEGGQ